MELTASNIELKMPEGGAVEHEVQAGSAATAPPTSLITIEDDEDEG
jgi:hypothetical protein